MGGKVNLIWSPSHKGFIGITKSGVIQRSPIKEDILIFSNWDSEVFKATILC